MKKILSILLAALLAFSLAASAFADDGENYDTGDASLDDARNADGIGDDELLVVSFGTSFNDNRRLTIGAIETALEDAFPDWSVRRGFTSQIVIDHVLERDGEVIDNVDQALQRAVDNGVKRLVVQPTHLMDGYEYNDLADAVARYADKFEAVALGKPVLADDADFQAVAKAVTAATAAYDDGRTAIVFMGHGTEAASNGVYAKMQQALTDGGYANYFVGTVEAKPDLDDVLAAVGAGDYSRVVLRPLMIVAGDHANNDMAGDGEDSWKSAFQAAGYEVACLVQGLGELEDIQALLVSHAQAAMDTLGQGELAPAAGQDEANGPVYAEDLQNGTYAIAVDSSSSMFRVVSCTLTAADGAMTAAMTMGGTGYLYVYPGTADEAAKADTADYIPFREDENGAHVFTVPVEALNADVPLAAFSKNKQTWYDRTLVFRSDALPEDAFAASDCPDLADGTYTVAVTLSGGSGKASVESPAVLTVENGQVTARLVWSSSNYDYMKLDGVRYDLVNTEVNSAFDIPVTAFDEDIPVVADTVAMSAPHEIEYTLRFDGASIRAQP